MSQTAFRVYTTDELSVAQLSSLRESFNRVFEKATPLADLIRHYTVNATGFSYHSIMEDEGLVAGSLTAVPFIYSCFGEKRTFCYLGGLFILPEYRKDPLAMFKMYRNLKAKLTEAGVSVLMAVPNKNSYPYFIHALKWKEVCTLPYYALPVNFGTISGKSRMLNYLSGAFVRAHFLFNSLLNMPANRREKPSGIFLLPGEPLMETFRYGDEHRKVTQKKFRAFWRMEDEEGIRTAYLIDYYNDRHARDSRSLLRAVKYIVAHEKPDLLLWIGTMKMPQTVLFRVPKSKEPRHLNFCVDVIDKINIPKAVYNEASWNFGLYNFDAR